MPTAPWKTPATPPTAGASRFERCGPDAQLGMGEEQHDVADDRDDDRDHQGLLGDVDEQQRPGDRADHAGDRERRQVAGVGVA